MKNIVFGLFILILVSGQRCADEDYTKLLAKKWIHSYEEDSAGLQTYRPVGYNFPPSRGRRGMEFKTDGEYIRYDIAPSDGELPIYGKWEPIADQKVIRITLEKPKQETYKLEILFLDPNQLRVKKN